MDVGVVNNLLHVVSKNLEGHKVTNGFTDTNPVSMMFMTVQRERCVIHMIVYWLLESEVKEGADVIGGAMVLMLSE
jgi:hypothetical protein